MKKILILIAFICTLVNAEVKLTKELIDNDIETNEYQLFVTKTVNIPTDNLKAKVVFIGELEDYFEKYKTIYEQDMTEELSLIAGETGKVILRAAFSLDNSNIFFGDANYAQVTDYTNNGEFATRIIKYIISDENLPKEDQEMIYATTNSDSYHFNKGKVRLLFTTDKQLNHYRKGLK